MFQKQRAASETDGPLSCALLLGGERRCQRLAYLQTLIAKTALRAVWHPNCWMTCSSFAPSLILATEDTLASGISMPIIAAPTERIGRDSHGRERDDRDSSAKYSNNYLFHDFLLRSYYCTGSITSPTIRPFTVTAIKTVNHGPRQALCG